MGKGIAYQFKLQFPENNNDYVRACKSGSLVIGKLHYYNEKGLNQLVILAKDLNLSSIAIPPLGNGNGGLIWANVNCLLKRNRLIYLRI